MRSPLLALTAVVALVLAGTGCGDDGELTPERIAGLLAEGLSEQGDLSAEASACVAEIAVAEVGAERLLAGLEDAEDDLDAIDPALADALVAATLGALEPCGVDLLELTGDPSSR